MKPPTILLSPRHRYDKYNDFFSHDWEVHYKLPVNASEEQSQAAKKRKRWYEDINKDEHSKNSNRYFIPKPTDTEHNYIQSASEERQPQEWRSEEPQSVSSVALNPNLLPDMPLSTEGHTSPSDSHVASVEPRLPGEPLQAATPHPSKADLSTQNQPSIEIPYLPESFDNSISPPGDTVLETDTEKLVSLPCPPEVQLSEPDQVDNGPRSAVESTSGQIVISGLASSGRSEDNATHNDSNMLASPPTQQELNHQAESSSLPQPPDGMYIWLASEGIIQSLQIPSIFENDDEPQLGSIQVWNERFYHDHWQLVSFISHAASAIFEMPFPYKLTKLRIDPMLVYACVVCTIPCTKFFETQFPGTRSEYIRDAQNHGQIKTTPTNVRANLLSDLKKLALLVSSQSREEVLQLPSSMLQHHWPSLAMLRHEHLQNRHRHLYLHNMVKHIHGGLWEVAASEIPNKFWIKYLTKKTPASPKTLLYLLEDGSGGVSGRYKIRIRAYIAEILLPKRKYFEKKSRPQTRGNWDLSWNIGDQNIEESELPNLPLAETRAQAPTPTGELFVATPVSDEPPDQPTTTEVPTIVEPTLERPVIEEEVHIGTSASEENPVDERDDINEENPAKSEDPTPKLDKFSKMICFYCAVILIHEVAKEAENFIDAAYLNACLQKYLYVYIK